MKTVSETKLLIESWQNTFRQELEKNRSVDSLNYIRGVIDGLRLAMGLPFSENTLEPVILEEHHEP